MNEQEEETCIADDCDKPLYNSRGLCTTHYHRWRRETMRRNKEVGGKKTRMNDINYEEFWLFVKSHVVWDENGRPLKVKIGLTPDWRERGKDK